MAEFSTDIRQLYEEAFNVSPTKYFASTGVQNLPPFGFDVELLQEPEADVTSVLGTPVLTSFVIKGGTARDGTEYEGMDLSRIAPMIEVSRPRNIVTTTVPDAESTVKELITDGDFQVLIRGVLVNPEQEVKPYDQMEQLNNLAGVNDALEVDSEFLTRLGIYNVVVRNLRFTRDQNVNAQAFTLDCLHDTPEELLIEEAE